MKATQPPEQAAVTAPHAPRRGGLARLVRWTLIGVLLVVGVVAAQFILQTRQARLRGVSAAAAAAGKPVPVRTELVRTEVVTEVAGGPGLTRPARTFELALLSFRLGQDRTETYRVEKVHAAMGSVVRDGDVLVEVESSFQEKQIDARQADVSAAMAQVALIEAQLKTAARVRELSSLASVANVAFSQAAVAWREADQQRVAQLRKDGTATETELGEARSHLAEAKFHLADAQRKRQDAGDDLANGAEIDASKLAAARAAVADAQRSLEAASREIDQAKLTSRIDGIVDAVQIDEGEVVAGAQPLMTVIQLDPILFVAEMPQERLDLIRPGADAEVTLDAYPRETFTGTIVRISPQVEKATRAFDTVIEIPNPNRRLKAGLSGYARVRVTRPATTVPAAAIVQRDARAVAFVVKDGTARLRPIALGARVAPETFAVVGGLAPGDAVVIYGLKNLRDGDRVNADWRSWALRTPAAGDSTHATDTPNRQQD